MKSSFTPHHKTALLGLSLVPSVMVTMSFDELMPSNLLTYTQMICHLHSVSLASYIIGRLKWQQCLTEYGLSSLPVTPTMTLKHATSMYPNIKVLITILCTLPVIS
jgi:hypothetical protein